MVASRVHLEQTPCYKSNDILNSDPKSPLADLHFSATVLTNMLFSEEDAPLLKKWIVKRLENT
jgi:hypothetical protein